MADWSREEVEATVADYFDMLAAEISGVPYNKTNHRRRLAERLQKRSEASIEFKHANISAVLIDLWFPYISGYKPRSNYQSLLYDVVAERLSSNPQLLAVAEADADGPIVVPEVDDILSVLEPPPCSPAAESRLAEPPRKRMPATINYLEREARNRSLGVAGEQFVIHYERARLIQGGKSHLADKIEHVSQARGDGDGFDVLSFELNGGERLIEVKTTKYGEETPFFVSRNELRVSEARVDHYHLYRVFRFKVAPRIYVLSGALSKTCILSPAVYVASASAS